MYRSFTLFAVQNAFLQYMAETVVTKISFYPSLQLHIIGFDHAKRKKKMFFFTSALASAYKQL